MMFSLADTILAISSAPGVSARAIVRIAGPDAWDVVREVQSEESSLSLVLPTRGVHRAVLRLAPEAGMALPDSSLPAPLLPVTVLTFPSPHSYSGDQTIELIVPGNPLLLDRLLESLRRTSPAPRMAQPGEFTARAFLRGKLSLQQAEGVAALIAARNAEQIEAAHRLMDAGARGSGTTYRAWADELTTLLALVEAGIDFTDQEDVVPIRPEALHTGIDSLLVTIAASLGDCAGKESIHDLALPRVVLVGPPNAGKSTLFNALLGSRRAVASPLAGTTRDVIAEVLDLSADMPGAGSVLLHDLPGLEGTDRSDSPADRAAQAAASDALARADLLLLCQALRGQTPERVGQLREDQAWRGQGLPDVPVLHINTFADRGSLVDSSPTTDAIRVCALDGFNIPLLRHRIAAHAISRYGSGLASLLPRHRDALTRTHAALAHARALIDPSAASLPHAEMLAEPMREALLALGELVGDISPDDVIGRVFATFCVGK